MANALYPKWKEGLMQGTANSSLAGTVKVALVDTGVYSYNAADTFYDAGGASDVIDAVVGTPQELTSKTYGSSSASAFDAADVTFTSVTGNSVEALVLYIDTGTSTTSRLVAYIDTSVTGLPVTPNGGNITITWNASGIFAL